LHKGDRVYADTALAGNDIFARSLHILTQLASGQSSGQVLSYDSGTGLLVVRDRLSPDEVTLRLAPDAAIVRQDRPVSAAELRPGTLVALVFRPDVTGHSVANRVSILAQPGETFTFSGRIGHLDIHTGVMVLIDPVENKSYEIAFDQRLPAVSEIREGTDVTVSTTFDGSRYAARAITVNRASTKQ
jgi:hypothetical protein